MNILLTCAGRRNYLVRYFQEALNGKGLVYAVDESASAPALHDADVSRVVPSVSDPDYIESILSICLAAQIKLLISLNDLELPVLARERDRFLQIGTVPVISHAQVIDTCFDKWATDKFLKMLGIKTPRTFLDLNDAYAALDHGDMHLPVVVKPRWGTASQMIEFPETRNELDLAVQLCSLRLKRSSLAQISASDPGNGLLIQEKMQGQEFGLDIINNLDGNYVTTFAKRKLGMRAGETDKAQTETSAQLMELGKTIGTALRHIGNLDCDVFMSENEVCVLELNPRFGGGYPFSHEAGANLPAALIAWASGKIPEADWLRVNPNVMFAKCDKLVKVREIPVHDRHCIHDIQIPVGTADVSASL
ncbi:MAG: ATP-grasp domain-containing protein [Desulfuromonadales bacterium]|nr:ATP-grasp domain-containing protein [Desulfuromonadales bacterium]